MIVPARKYRKHFLVSFVLQTTSKISSCFTPPSGKEHGEKETEIKSPFKHLQDSFSLAVRVNQSINPFRRNPVLATTASKIFKTRQKSIRIFSMVFWRQIACRENKEKDKIPQKRKYAERSTNFKSSLKTQKRTSVETGQNYKSVNYRQSLHKASKQRYKYNHNQKSYHSTKN